MQLYPLKFTPILQTKIWGGHKLEKLFHKKADDLPNIGESWELSGYEDDISVVENGFLAGNNLTELIEVYMGELVGDKIYDKFGLTFPLLLKLIDANADLSIQVHPKDDVALERHNSFGKTEMWYVLDAEDGATLTVGFKNDSNQDEYTKALAAERVETLLQKVSVQKGDVVFIPAGLVHTIGKGVLLAEVQQTSNITYRIYDYNRKDTHGNLRQLHIQDALDVIDYQAIKEPKIDYKPLLNNVVNLVECDYFTTNIIHLNKKIERDYAPLDSFVVYMCLEEELTIKTNDYQIDLLEGETILIPACINAVEFIPKENTEVKLLEIYIA